MPVTPETEAKLVELLAEVYARIPWQKIRTSKNPYDIWNHRLRSAATRSTLAEFISKLCNAFGMQSTSERAVELLEELRPQERALLDLIYREHVPLAVRAALLASERKATRRAQKAEQLQLMEPERTQSERTPSEGGEKDA